MNCPVCDRSLAPTLSICPSCGAMMHDTVREELQNKITAAAAPRIEVRSAPPVERWTPQPRPSIAPPPVIRRQETADLVTHKTSPTLVEFQNKNAALPDWRIQLQNAVQQRKGGHGESASNNGTQYPTNGGNALKAEIVTRAEPMPPPEISDQRVANAMRRIDESRQAFLEPEAKPKKPMTARPAQMRPFGVVPSNGNMPSTAAAPARINTPPKPKLVSPPPAPVVEKRDTNKLPPLMEERETAIEIAEPLAAPIIDRVEKIESGPLPTEFSEIKRIRIRTEAPEIDEIENPETETDEIEDLAPFSMRFGAGLFDLIISGFAAMLALSPLAFTSGNWFTATGLLTFAGTWAIVSFMYMTVCLGFFGKTYGMRLFSLELVDAVENEYPTLRQAAVNSTIFLISLPLAGAGFLTMFFNEEKRAVHDLLSGTIIVREF